MIRALAGIAGIWILLMAALWLFQRQLIYLPDSTPTSPPAAATVSTVETSDGIVHDLWLVPAEGEAAARLVVFNGNAGNKSHRLSLAENLAAEGLEVVLFDYRGYGDTAGSPSEEGLLEDARAVADMAFATDLPWSSWASPSGRQWPRCWQPKGHPTLSSCAPRSVLFPIWPAPTIESSQRS